MLRERSATCEAVKYRRERSTRLIWLTSLRVGNAASNAAFSLDMKPCLMNCKMCGSEYIDHDTSVEAMRQGHRRKLVEV